MLGFFSFPFSLSPYISASFIGTPERPWHKAAAAAPLAVTPPADKDAIRAAEQTADRLLQQKHLKHQWQQQQQQQEEEDALTWIGQPDPIFALEED